MAERTEADNRLKQAIIKSEKKGISDEVRRCVESGASPDADWGCESSPLSWSVMFGMYDMVRFLCSRGFSIDPPGPRDPPIFIVCGSGDIKMIRLLLDLGADPNRISSIGMTPLHCAVRGFFTEETVRILLEYGADPNIQDHRKMSPLHAAAEKGEVGVMKMLIEAGADFNIRDKKDRTPLDILKADHVVKWKENGEELTEFAAAASRIRKEDSAAKGEATDYEFNI